jgi:hypothetical protein
MAILTATEVSSYAPNISASATTIINGNYIQIVQDRVCLITNNYFTSDELSIKSTVLFDATAGTITLDAEYWENYGFKAGDDFLVYRSYRNDGVKTIESLADTVLTVTSSCSVIKEDFNNNSGPVIYFSVVQWPVAIKQIAALMIQYDTDYRDKNAAGIKHRSLGPYSETFADAKEDEYGYPAKLTNKLEPYTIARFM